MWFQCQKFITNIFRKVSFPCLFPLPYIMLNCAKLPKINYFIIKNAISVVVAATAKSLQLCPTLWPHRQQPTRLPRPWDYPGKNTGVGCHFLLQCRKVKSESEIAQLCPTLSYPMDCSPPGSSVHGIFQARVLEWGAIAFSEKASTTPQIYFDIFVREGEI